MSLQKNTIMNENLKRFKLLLEYDFYVPEAYEEVGNGLLGEEDPTDEDDALGDAPVDDSSDELGDSENTGDDSGDSSNEPMGDEFGDEESTDDSDGPIDFSGDAEEPSPETIEEPPLPAENEIELDVTQLVQGTDQAKASADQANKQLMALRQQFNDLTSKLSKIDGITQKIDSLEHEIEKRNPTEQEKLEMRSLSSYPYNLKLTDYWAEKEGAYDVMNNNGQREPKEFVLTQDDVNADFNSNAVRDSFDLDDFEEEDI